MFPRTKKSWSMRKELYKTFLKMFLPLGWAGAASCGTKLLTRLWERPGLNHRGLGAFLTEISLDKAIKPSPECCVLTFPKAVGAVGASPSIPRAPSAGSLTPRRIARLHLRLGAGLTRN